MPEILHYRGDVRNFDPDHLLGPDVGRRRLTIKSIDYDADTDMSTATLRGVLPANFRELLEPKVAQEQARERIRKLFVG